MLFRVCLEDVSTIDLQINWIREPSVLPALELCELMIFLQEKNETMGKMKNKHEQTYNDITISYNILEYTKSQIHCRCHES